VALPAFASRTLLQQSTDGLPAGACSSGFAAVDA